MVSHLFSLRFGRLVLNELRAVSPTPGDNPLKFLRWLIKVYRESDAPLQLKSKSEVEAKP